MALKCHSRLPNLKLLKLSKSNSYMILGPEHGNIEFNVKVYLMKYLTKSLKMQ